MKKSLPCLLLCLLLAGCSAFPESSYRSVRPHKIENAVVSTDILTISDYSGLCKGLENLISDGMESGLVYYEQYEETELISQLGYAIIYATEKFPIGAYAVKDIEYALGTNNGLPAIAFTIRYHHPRSEILQIQSVDSLDAAKDAIVAALTRMDNELLLLVNGYRDSDLAQYVEDYAWENPNVVMEIPKVSALSYPSTGGRRVLEIKFKYSNSRDALRDMKNTVSPIFSSAALYVTQDAEAHEKYQQLYIFLTQRSNYRIETSVTPAYSLLRHGVGDSQTFALVYGAMCRGAGLDCLTVNGSYHGKPRSWNILCEDGRYFHLDLLACMANGGYQEKYDSDMQDYVWDYSAFPVCENTAAEEPIQAEPLPVPVEEDSAETTGSDNTDVSETDENPN